MAEENGPGDNLDNSSFLKTDRLTIGSDLLNAAELFGGTLVVNYETLAENSNRTLTQPVTADEAGNNYFVDLDGDDDDEENSRHSINETNNLNSANEINDNDDAVSELITYNKENNDKINDNFKEIKQNIISIEDMDKINDNLERTHTSLRIYENNDKVSNHLKETDRINDNLVAVEKLDDNSSFLKETGKVERVDKSSDNIEVDEMTFEDCDKNVKENDMDVDRDELDMDVDSCGVDNQKMDVDSNSKGGEAEEMDIDINSGDVEIREPSPRLLTVDEELEGLEVEMQPNENVLVPEQIEPVVPDRKSPAPTKDSYINGNIDDLPEKATVEQNAELNTTINQNPEAATGVENLSFKSEKQTEESENSIYQTEDNHTKKLEPEIEVVGTDPPTDDVETFLEEEEEEEESNDGETVHNNLKDDYCSISKKDFVFSQPESIAPVLQYEESCDSEVEQNVQDNIVSTLELPCISSDSSSTFAQIEEEAIELPSAEENEIWREDSTDAVENTDFVESTLNPPSEISENVDLAQYKILNEDSALTSESCTRVQITNGNLPQDVARKNEDKDFLNNEDSSNVGLSNVENIPNSENSTSSMEPIVLSQKLNAQVIEAEKLSLSGVETLKTQVSSNIIETNHDRCAENSTVENESEVKADSEGAVVLLTDNERHQKQNEGDSKEPMQVADQLVIVGEKVMCENEDNIKKTENNEDCTEIKTLTPTNDEDPNLKEAPTGFCKSLVENSRNDQETLKALDSEENISQVLQEECSTDVSYDSHNEKQNLNDPKEEEIGKSPSYNKEVFHEGVYTDPVKQLDSGVVNEAEVERRNSVGSSTESVISNETTPDKKDLQVLEDISLCKEFHELSNDSDSVLNDIEWPAEQNYFVEPKSYFAPAHSVKIKESEGIGVEHQRKNEVLKSNWPSQEVAETVKFLVAEVGDNYENKTEVENKEKIVSLSTVSEGKKDEPMEVDDELENQFLSESNDEIMDVDLNEDILDDERVKIAAQPESTFLEKDVPSNFVDEDGLSMDENVNSRDSNQNSESLVKVIISDLLHSVVGGEDGRVDKNTSLTMDEETKAKSYENDSSELLVESIVSEILDNVVVRKLYNTEVSKEKPVMDCSGGNEHQISEFLVGEIIEELLDSVVYNLSKEIRMEGDTEAGCEDLNRELLVDGIISGLLDSVVNEYKRDVPVYDNNLDISHETDDEYHNSKFLVEGIISDFLDSAVDECDTGKTLDDAKVEIDECQNSELLVKDVILDLLDSVTKNPSDDMKMDYDDDKHSMIGNTVERDEYTNSELLVQAILTELINKVICDHNGSGVFQNKNEKIVDDNEIKLKIDEHKLLISDDESEDKDCEMVENNISEGLLDIVSDCKPVVKIDENKLLKDDNEVQNKEYKNNELLEQEQNVFTAVANEHGTEMKIDKDLVPKPDNELTKSEYQKTDSLGEETSMRLGDAVSNDCKTGVKIDEENVLMSHTDLGKSEENRELPENLITELGDTSVGESETDVNKDKLLVDDYEGQKDNNENSELQKLHAEKTVASSSMVINENKLRISDSESDKNEITKLETVHTEFNDAVSEVDIMNIDEDKLLMDDNEPESVKNEKSEMQKLHTELKDTVTKADMNIDEDKLLMDDNELEIDKNEVSALGKIHTELRETVAQVSKADEYEDTLLINDNESESVKDPMSEIQKLHKELKDTVTKADMNIDEDKLLMDGNDSESVNNEMSPVGKLPSDLRETSSEARKTTMNIDEDKLLVDDNYSESVTDEKSQLQKSHIELKDTVAKGDMNMHEDKLLINDNESESVQAENNEIQNLHTELRETVAEASKADVDEDQLLMDDGDSESVIDENSEIQKLHTELKDTVPKTDMNIDEDKLLMDDNELEIDKSETNALDKLQTVSEASKTNLSVDEDKLVMDDNESESVEGDQSDVYKLNTELDIVEKADMNIDEDKRLIDGNDSENVNDEMNAVGKLPTDLRETSAEASKADVDEDKLLMDDNESESVEGDRSDVQKVNTELDIVEKADMDMDEDKLLMDDSESETELDDNESKNEKDQKSETDLIDEFQEEQQLESVPKETPIDEGTSEPSGNSLDVNNGPIPHASTQTVSEEIQHLLSNLINQVTEITDSSDSDSKSPIEGNSLTSAPEPPTESHSHISTDNESRVVISDSDSKSPIEGNSSTSAPEPPTESHSDISTDNESRVVIPRTIRRMVQLADPITFTYIQEEVELKDCVCCYGPPQYPANRYGAVAKDNTKKLLAEREMKQWLLDRTKRMQVVLYQPILKLREGKDKIMKEPMETATSTSMIIDDTSCSARSDETSEEVLSDIINTVVVGSTETSDCVHKDDCEGMEESVTESSSTTAKQMVCQSVVLLSTEENKSKHDSIDLDCQLEDESWMEMDDDEIIKETELLDTTEVVIQDLLNNLCDIVSQMVKNDQSSFVKHKLMVEDLTEEVDEANRILENLSNSSDNGNDLVLDEAEELEMLNAGPSGVEEVMDVRGAVGLDMGRCTPIIENSLNSILESFGPSVDYENEDPDSVIQDILNNIILNIVSGEEEPFTLIPSIIETTSIAVNEFDMGSTDEDDRDPEDDDEMYNSNCKLQTGEGLNVNREAVEDTSLAGVSSITTQLQETARGSRSHTINLRQIKQESHDLSYYIKQEFFDCDDEYLLREDNEEIDRKPILPIITETRKRPGRKKALTQETPPKRRRVPSAKVAVKPKPTTRKKATQPAKQKPKPPVKLLKAPVVPTKRQVVKKMPVAKKAPAAVPKKVESPKKTPANVKQASVKAAGKAVAAKSVPGKSASIKTTPEASPPAVAAKSASARRAALLEKQEQRRKSAAKNRVSSLKPVTRKSAPLPKTEVKEDITRKRTRLSQITSTTPPEVETNVGALPIKPVATKKAKTEPPVKRRNVAVKSTGPRILPKRLEDNRLQKKNFPARNVAKKSTTQIFRKPIGVFVDTNFGSQCMDMFFSENDEDMLDSSGQSSKKRKASKFVDDYQRWSPKPSTSTSTSTSTDTKRLKTDINCAVKLNRIAILDRLFPSKKSPEKVDPNICELCEPKRIFLSKLSLTTHINEEHVNRYMEPGMKPGTSGEQEDITISINEDTDTCMGCCKKFYSKNRLVEHIKTCNNVLRMPKSPGISSIGKNVSVTHKKAAKQEVQDLDSLMQHICNICNKKFLMAAGLTAHLKTHQSTIKPISIKTEKPGKSKKKIKNSVIEALKCNVCNEKFLQVSELVEHTSKHSVPTEEKKDLLLKNLNKFIGVKVSLNNVQVDKFAEKRLKNVQVEKLSGKSLTSLGKKQPEKRLVSGLGEKLIDKTLNNKQVEVISDKRSKVRFAKCSGNIQIEKLTERDDSDDGNFCNEDFDSSFVDEIESEEKIKPYVSLKLRRPKTKHNVKKPDYPVKIATGKLARELEKQKRADSTVLARSQLFENLKMLKEKSANEGMADIQNIEDFGKGLKSNTKIKVIDLTKSGIDKNTSEELIITQLSKIGVGVSLVERPNASTHILDKFSGDSQIGVIDEFVQPSSAGSRITIPLNQLPTKMLTNKGNQEIAGIQQGVKIGLNDRVGTADKQFQSADFIEKHRALKEKRKELQTVNFLDLSLNPTTETSMTSVKSRKTYLSGTELKNKPKSSTKTIPATTAAENIKIASHSEVTRKSYESDSICNITEPLKCTVCDRVFTIQSVYDKHISYVNRVRLLEDKTKCPICEEHISLPCRLGAHIEKHTVNDGVSATCRICSKVFRSENNLIRHELEHEGQLDVNCQYCGVILQNMIELYAHQSECKANREFKCNVCNKIFSAKWRLDLHMRSDDAHSKFSLDSNRAIFYCDRCGKDFKKMSLLTVHLSSNCGTEPLFECLECSKRYFSQSSLSSHKRTQHSKVKNYMCQYCSKEFYTSFNLNRHEQGHNPGLKTYDCKFPNCNKIYRKLDSLKAHECEHTGIYPYSCELCGVQFSTLKSFKSHNKAKNHWMDESLQDPMKGDNSEVPQKGWKFVGHEEEVESEKQDEPKNLVVSETQFENQLFQQDSRLLAHTQYATLQPFSVNHLIQQSAVVVQPSPHSALSSYSAQVLENYFVVTNQDGALRSQFNVL